MAVLPRGLAAEGGCGYTSALRHRELFCHPLCPGLAIALHGGSSAIEEVEADHQLHGAATRIRADARDARRRLGEPHDQDAMSATFSRVRDLARKWRRIRAGLDAL